MEAPATLPERAEAAMIRGQAAWALQRTAEAMEAYQAAIDLLTRVRRGPLHRQLWYDLAELLEPGWHGRPGHHRAPRGGQGKRSAIGPEDWTPVSPTTADTSARRLDHRRQDFRRRDQQQMSRPGLRHRPVIGRRDAPNGRGATPSPALPLRACVLRFMSAPPSLCIVSTSKILAHSVNIVVASSRSSPVCRGSRPLRPPAEWRTPSPGLVNSPQGAIGFSLAMSELAARYATRRPLS